jgi:hypothetical protein
MAKLNRQGGYFVEYLEANGESRFVACNSHREEAMDAARGTQYVTRVWEADGCAIEEDILLKHEGGYYHIDTILFLINPRLIFENINKDLFEV